jgi:AcrR family transcriptional regulator
VAGSRKGERGRQTRARIVEAATHLFCEQGYLDTTMAAIAAAADVAVQTLYLSFGSKGAILKAAHDVAVAGDDEPIPVLERPWVAELRGESDSARALELVLANSLEILERVAPIYGVIQAAAADPEVAEQLQQNKARRFATLQPFAEELATKPGFARTLSPDAATDVLYAVLSEELHRLLVVERQWPIDRWKAWTYEIAVTQLFPQLEKPKSRRASVKRREASSEVIQAP